jgi:hypothetical protein
MIYSAIPRTFLKQAYFRAVLVKNAVTDGVTDVSKQGVVN